MKAHLMIKHGLMVLLGKDSAERLHGASTLVAWVIAAMMATLGVHSLIPFINLPDMTVLGIGGILGVTSIIVAKFL